MTEVTKLSMKPRKMRKRKKRSTEVNSSMLLGTSRLISLIEPVTVIHADQGEEPDILSDDEEQVNLHCFVNIPDMYI